MVLSSHKIRVGVLRGGPSSEYGVSLETGKNVLAHLPEEFYTPVDILVSKEGVWHEAGVQREPNQVLKRLDVVWNALHGKYGGGGGLSKMLENFNVPHTGSRPLSSAISMNKILSKKIYRDSGLKTPFSMQINFDDLSRDSILEIYHGMPGPYVVKPASSGSSVGVRIVYSRPELEEAIVSAFEYSPQVLVEEFIKGKEVFVGVLDSFRNKGLYPLIPLSEKLLSTSEKNDVENMSLKAHEILQLGHYSSSDFIIHPKRGIFILETDMLPPLHSKSNFLKSLQNVGANFPDFLHHILSLALGNK